MALDVAQFFGKPVQDLDMTTVVPEREDAPDLEDIVEEMMSVKDLERALASIRAKRKKLDIFGGTVGSGKVVTASSLLTGA